MTLENQLDGPVQTSGPIITPDEEKLIDTSGMPIYVWGMLSVIRRTGGTLEEIYQQAISEPGNEEHIAEVQQARGFLAKNSVRFGLGIIPDKPA